MSMIIKRRQLVMATLVVALGAAVFVNWYFTRSDLDVTDSTTALASENLGDAEYVNSNTNTTASTTKSSDTDEYFAQAKLKRENAHDKALDTINSVITNNNSSKTAVENASAELTKLSNLIKQEADIENLIMAKVSGSCIVILNGGTAEVVVAKGVLTDNVIMQIKEIVIKQTELSADKITILEAK